MADLTPGTDRIRFIASISIWIDSSSAMLGTRTMLGTSEPSFISGIKEVPNHGISAKAPPNSASARNKVLRVLASAHESIGL